MKKKSPICFDTTFVKTSGRFFPILLLSHNALTLIFVLGVAVFSAEMVHLKEQKNFVKIFIFETNLIKEILLIISKKYFISNPSASFCFIESELIQFDNS